MTGHVPEVGTPFLRDYLYINRARTRMLLAQIANGSPETVTRVEQRQKSLSLKSPIVDASIGLAKGEQYSSDVTDLAFSLMEDAAEETGFLKEASELCSVAKNWKRGSVKKALPAGSMFRVEGDLAIIDPATLREKLQQLDHLFPDEEEAEDSFEDQTFKFGLKMMSAMYGNGVTIRSFPAGTDEAACHFSGSLDNVEESFDRPSLWARYGGMPAPWTMVAQVSYSPAETSRPVPAIDESRLSRGSKIDRVELEKLFTWTISELMESGMSEAPAHPAIAVVPIAIYRTVLPHDESNSDA